MEFLPGNVDAVKNFFDAAQKEPFDYTEWRQNKIHEDISIKDLSKEAMDAEN